MRISDWSSDVCSSDLHIAPASAPQRTVYLEKPAVAGQKTVFSVTYELTLLAQYHAIDPARVQPATITPALAPLVAERRSEERRLGKECVNTVRSRGSTYH